MQAKTGVKKLAEPWVEAEYGAEMGAKTGAEIWSEAESRTEDGAEDDAGVITGSRTKPGVVAGATAKL